jgi:TfoX/Sxy family transcriptional regulator of competence genes
MVAVSVNALRSLLAAATSELEQGITIECKHFFSGAAAYANGHIFMTLTSVGVALKLPRESQTELVRRGAKPLRYFRHGPSKKDYVIVPDGIAQNAEALAPWVVKSILFSQAFSQPRRATPAGVRPGR